MTYYKITNREENHRGFQYVDGLNILKDQFSDHGSCVKGGLYFTDAKNIFKYLEYGIYLREIILPTDNPIFLMIQDPTRDKFRANMIILGKRYELADPRTIQMLIESGAKINAKNDLALRWAVKNNNLDIVKLLVLNGADINNKKIFCEAVMNGNISIVEFILKNKTNPFVHPGAIIYASAFGHIEIIKILIEQGVNFHILNNFALRLASEFGHSDVVEFLLNMGANVNAANNYALNSASEYGRLDVIKILLQYGTNLHTDNDLAFRLACKSNDIQVIEYLLSNGADIDANNNEAIRYATYCKGDNNNVIINFLIEKGASVFNISDDDKKLCWVNIEKYREISKSMEYKQFNKFEKKIYNDILLYGFYRKHYLHL